MKTKRFILIALALVIPLALLGFGLAKAQDAQPQGQVASPDAKSSNIPIQGRLTDETGAPLADGTYTITLRLYEVSTGGTSICEDPDQVQVTDGLFSADFGASGCLDGANTAIDGRQLYLGIEVEDDGEMTPRQPIQNVFYAWGLRPGAMISDTYTNDAIVHIENSGTTGRGLRVYATDEDTKNYGIVGAARTAHGIRG
jgi:hypothetical protein